LRGLFVPEEFEEHSGKPEDRIRRKTLGVREVPHRMKGPMDVGAPIHQVKDFFFLGHDSFALLGHEREKKSRQVTSGGKVTAGWLRDALGKISLND
jgi:hypothetical protein